jgi:hypothetical protein
VYPAPASSLVRKGTPPPPPPPVVLVVLPRATSGRSYALNPEYICGRQSRRTCAGVWAVGGVLLSAEQPVWQQRMRWCQQVTMATQRSQP